MDKIKTFKPKVGDTFYYVSVRYCCHCVEDGIDVRQDKCRSEQQVKSLGSNCYRSFMDAAKICDRVRRAFNLTPLLPTEQIEIF